MILVTQLRSYHADLRRLSPILTSGDLLLCLCDSELETTLDPAIHAGTIVEGIEPLLQGYRLA
jgi:hypothetical protein